MIAHNSSIEIEFKEVLLKVFYNYTPPYFSSDYDSQNEPEEAEILEIKINGENIYNLLVDDLTEIEKLVIENLKEH